MYIHRQIETELRPFLERKEAVALLGPRQAGKTTLMRHIAEEWEKNGKKVKFITLEKRSDLELFQDSIEDFKSLVEDYDCVIIDEFQYAKDGGQKLKYLYDTTGIKFIISGSSSLELRFQTGKYMVGRLFDFKLLPFSFREFLSVADTELFVLLNKQIDPASFLRFHAKKGFGPAINKRLAGRLEDYIVYGGYPAVVLSKTGSEKQKVLESIIEKYLLRDIKGLLNLATDDDLIRLSKFLSTQVGGLINFNELSNASGLNYKSVLQHLNILERTFIIELIRPFFTNRRTELVKNQKNYFVDLGVRNFLISDFRRLEKRDDAGSVMENYAYNLLSRLLPSSKMKYWRTKSGAEVDFVVETEGGVCPIEVKYASTRIVGKSFYSFIEKFKPKVGVILTKDFWGEEKIGKATVKFIPLSYF
ncbi:MAG: hypothetical protein A3C85_02585 [Candidatus Doudnabacteria bacterium RIFCSPHIGHO2_02_FULL_48_21]|uniref:AAA+ ATPase domain-containing protein n=1 Tax=Candidatus Doudnabacteria bacterium RIFCSPLOWO2_02_FULL_48_13 TaxID=1817845 RepID=A0A1F5QD48_9BACT|nr:MAG: hypothetical protein A3F44_00555 [Candidatus Doudnabacteria bacterium RIFCSPHIGHO2_12_FULL_47_25]OGE93712.1 MAG: hypothetical protein A3C85_02585 [Candidatus Doudnabacteria bacterium RIFCSPHIGHO2_02_FULL_48_21]OGE97901.1 MAG: hypothetical protein A3A83_00365 [Candidatus Doudnabacteria bacterium RIFCSPLOWO2_01_FULL_48_57]OGF00132.1 MAG: hypothetical protein A3J05_03475 [Candidatus Doudnabacteria bacterium RIFCSPLOWO2_02_FULL_48_13]